MRTYKANLSPEVTESEKKHSEFIRRISGECMVLLENDGTLPISGPAKIALYGNGARNTVKGGTGSGDVNSRSVTNIEEGLEAAGFTITSKSWLDAQDKLVKEENDNYQAELPPRLSPEQRVRPACSSNTAVSGIWSMPTVPQVSD